MRISAAWLLSVALVSQTADLRSTVSGWANAHRQAVLDELTALLSIPNVASDKPSIRRNAEHIRDMFAKRGIAAEILETTGNPLVYGNLAVPGATRTVLFYCHYDGQPVDRSKWRQPDPFTPVTRGEGADARIYARSASDDKAPIVALLSALDALTSANLAPTSNVKFIFEGEEEAGSVSLVSAIARYRDKLRADLMIILDGPGHSSGRPTIAYGARGIALVNLTVYGPKSGVHSGNYGNWIPNPAVRLAQLLASMKTDDGRVTVAGYYDAVPPFGDDDRALLDGVPEDADRMLKTFGVAEPEKAFPKLQYALQYPTLNVRGLSSAYVGAGARTIIPDRATAALDLRLVKETPAVDLVAKLRAHVEKQGYHIVDADPDDATRAKFSRIARLEIDGPSTNAFRTPVSDPQARAVVASITRTFGQPPVQLRTLGGTVPIAPFIEALGFPALTVPTVNFDNNQHEENENLRISTFFDSISIIAALLRM
ncbi:MAG TPA: M20/M25/M40 family metallo-hydrolase [Vicinamibacterales bacterium]|jgi:acetylornithine deacetylase/succinyl-diaminopimelate desuccinylase-like protein|nr:M20/M25/M40 family metallo-hydrolase [Vicinamibacterales bacterium]